MDNTTGANNGVMDAALAKKYGTYEVDVINSADSLTDAQVMPVMNALQVQLAYGSVFSIMWGVSVNLHYVPKGGVPDGKHWWLTIMDHLQQAGALGYHDLTSTGQPIGKVGVLDGGLWTTTLSHEALEQAIDPFINGCLQVSDTRFVAYEIADAPEADQYGYKINDVLVSDYVFPLYFCPTVTGVVKFDHEGHIKQAMEILDGGYLSILDINNSLGWQQISGPGRADMSKVADNSRKDAALYQRPPVGSRRERRAVGSEQWVKSTVPVV